LVWLVTVGCSAEGPTGPSPLFLPYEDPIANTTHNLTLLGFDFVPLGPNESVVQSCVGIGPSRLKIVSASVLVRRIGATWRVMPATGNDGRFALYFHANGTSSGHVPVTGTIRGFMNNTAVAPGHKGGDLRVTVDAGESDVPLEGAVHHHLPLAKGLIGGPITFSAPDGMETRCMPGAVSWSLSGPLP
jgi:hypothetical protein